MADDAKLREIVVAGGADLGGRHYTIDDTLMIHDRQDVCLRNGLVIGRFNEADKPVIGILGGQRITFDRVRVRTAGAPAAAALAIGRSEKSGSQHHSFKNCDFEGHYPLAGVVNVGGEMHEWDNLRVCNYCDNGHGFLAAAWWPEDWRARLDFPCRAGREWNGPYRVACGQHTFSGGDIAVRGFGGEEACVRMLPGAHNLTMTGTHLRNQHGFAGIRYGHEDVPRLKYRCRTIVLNGCWLEGSVPYGVYADSDLIVESHGGRWECETGLVVAGPRAEVLWNGTALTR